MNFFASNIHFLRKKKGLKQAEILAAIGFPRTTWSSYENEASEPDIDGILRIASFFGVSVSDILEKDLQNAHLNENDDEKTRVENAHLNAHQNAHLNEKKEEFHELAENEGEWRKKDRQPGEVVRLSVPRVITLDTSGEENAVLVPVRARAGYLQGYGDAKFIEKLPHFKIWGHTGRTYRIFEVDGNSMFNTLHDGDKVKAYWVQLSDIRKGQIYVVVTQHEGLLIKRIISHDNGVLVLKSDNNHHGEHPPIVLDVHEVRELWHVEEYTSRMMGEPGEWYQRMISLEAKVAIMEHKLLKGSETSGKM